MEFLENLTEAFGLATGASKLVKEILEIKKNNKKQDENDAVFGSSGGYAKIGSSGGYAQIGSSGYSAKIGSSGDSAQIGSSGYSAKIGSSGGYAQIGSSGGSAQIGSSGGSAQIGSSGDYAKIGSSGDSAQIGSSGDYAKIGSSGGYAQIGSSGGYAQIGSSGGSAQIGSSGGSAQIGSSGDYAKIGSSGDSAVVSAIGFNSIVKAKKGSWITLAEYRKNKDGKWQVYFVKTEFVDGEIIKEDTEYCLYEKEFREYIEADGIQSAVLHKRGKVYKVKNFNDDSESYLIEDNGIFSHGKTIKEARESFIYKIGDRDTSKYKDMTLKTTLTKAEAIQMYRTITGACERGTRYFMDNSGIKKNKATISEIIELTKGQYGHNSLVEFFKK